jgi:hypothetical protein
MCVYIPLPAAGAAALAPRRAGRTCKPACIQQLDRLGTCLQNQGGAQGWGGWHGGGRGRRGVGRGRAEGIHDLNSGTRTVAVAR